MTPLTPAERSPNDYVTAHSVPRWVAPAFALAAVVTIPWIVYLGFSLPRTVKVDDRAAWVGFDIGLVAMLGLTAFLAWRGRPKFVMAATATATMLIVDAWFDVLTSGRGVERDLALAMAVVEVLLAALCFWLAFHAAAVIGRRVRALAPRGVRTGEIATAGPTSAAAD